MYPMKKLLLGVCVLAGSINAMDVGKLNELRGWCVDHATDIPENMLIKRLGEDSCTVKDLIATPVPSGKGIKGDTWLHVFVRAQNEEIVALLSENEADWQVANELNETPVGMVLALKEDNEFKKAVEEYAHDLYLDVDEEEGDDRDVEKHLKKSVKGSATHEDAKGTETSDQKDKGKGEGSYYSYEDISYLRPEGGLMPDPIYLVLYYLTNGEKIHYESLRGKFKRGKLNVFEEVLTDRQSLGDWLLDAIESKSVPLDRALNVASVVGPYALKDGEHPFLYLLISHIIAGEASEHLYERFKGKAVIKDEHLLLEVRNGVGVAGTKEVCERILAQFEPLGEPIIKPIEDERGIEPSTSAAKDKDENVSPIGVGGKGKDEEDYFTYGELVNLLFFKDKGEPIFIENKELPEDLIFYFIAAEPSMLSFNRVKELVSDETQTNIFEVILANKQSLGDWLLDAIERKKVPLDRALEVASVVGPYAVKDGEHPFLHLLISHIITGEASEELLGGFIGKAVIKDDALLLEVRNGVGVAGTKEVCERILAQFAPQEEFKLDPVDDEKKPGGSSLVAKLLYGTGTLAVVYTAWQIYQWYTNPEKDGGLPVK